MLSPPSEFDSCRRYSVLVVDDDEEIREAVCALLSRLYDVSTAVDGIDGYEKALQHPPDLIISDVTMPRLDGFAMVRRIRKHDALRRLRVIFFTAQMLTPSVLEGLSVGPFAYLAKSIDPALFEKKVKRALTSN
jgi:CheY-like chemotaxis protein